MVISGSAALPSRSNKLAFFPMGMVKVTTDSNKEGLSMESTSQFVQRLAENQKKQEKNRKRGNKHPESKLPNHKHSQGV